MSASSIWYYVNGRSYKSSEIRCLTVEFYGLLEIHVDASVSFPRSDAMRARIRVRRSSYVAADVGRSAQLRRRGSAASDRASLDPAFRPRGLAPFRFSSRKENFARA